MLNWIDKQAQHTAIPYFSNNDGVFHHQIGITTIINANVGQRKDIGTCIVPVSGTCYLHFSIELFWLLNINIHNSQVLDHSLTLLLTMKLMRIESSLTEAIVALQNKQLPIQVWIDENDEYTTSVLKSVDLGLLFTLELQYFSKTLSHVWVKQKRKISFASKAN